MTTPNLRTIYKMQVLSVNDLTPSVRELKVKTVEPQEFHFRCGQFVMLHVPDPSAPKPALRAYSIATTDSDHQGFTLLFKYVDGGKASQFVWGLKGNETLNFTGPFGKVFFQEPPTEQIIFLNTGTGLSQHLSYLQSKKHQYPSLKYRLLFGVRNEQEIYYQPILAQLQKELKDFQYDYVLSRPSADWVGKKGYVQNFINDFSYLKIPSTFYLCGNGGMIKEVKEKLLSEGLDKSRIWVEAFD